MIALNGNLIKPTMFPDGTSQVWKISPSCFEKDRQSDNVVKWTFEHEAEFLHVLQLLDLVRVIDGGTATLQIPYFPYARQDKELSNTKTFALQSFCAALWAATTSRIVAFDVHSDRVEHWINMFTNHPFENIHPRELLEKVLTNYEAVVFPDQGAADRYGECVRDMGMPYLVAQKVRDQSTGRITDYTLDWPEEWDAEETRILVIDDICDGGATFIELGKRLQKILRKPPSLYVSHGIFSKGLDELKQFYKKIITTNSLPTKEKGLTVYESTPPHRLLQSRPQKPVPQGD